MLFKKLRVVKVFSIKLVFSSHFTKFSQKMLDYKTGWSVSVGLKMREGFVKE